MTGDDGAERHLSNAARRTATPGELVVNVATLPCLDVAVGVHVSHGPTRRVDDVEFVVAGRRRVTTRLTAGQRVSSSQR